MTPSATRHIEHGLTRLELQAAQLGIMLERLEVLLQPIPRHNKTAIEAAPERSTP